MNKDIDLTLNALFLGDVNPGEKITEHRQYDREHNIPTYHTNWVGGVHRREGMPVRRRRQLSFAMTWGLHHDVGVTMEPWYKHIFFTKKHTKVGENDYIKAYRKYFGDAINLLRKFDPYHEYACGEMCDCCGKRLNFFNRAKCWTLCTPCDIREFGGRDSARFFSMDAPWPDEMLAIPEFNKRVLSLKQKIEMRKNQFNRKLDEILNSK